MESGRIKRQNRAGNIKGRRNTLVKSGGLSEVL